MAAAVVDSRLELIDLPRTEPHDILIEAITERATVTTRVKTETKINSASDRKIYYMAKILEYIRRHTVHLKEDSVITIPTHEELDNFFKLTKQEKRKLEYYCNPETKNTIIEIAKEKISEIYGCKEFFTDTILTVFCYDSRDEKKENQEVIRVLFHDYDGNLNINLINIMIKKMFDDKLGEMTYHINMSPIVFCASDFLNMSFQEIFNKYCLYSSTCSCELASDKYGRLDIFLSSKLNFSGTKIIPSQTFMSEFFITVVSSAIRNREFVPKFYDFVDDLKKMHRENKVMFTEYDNNYNEAAERINTDWFDKTKNNIRKINFQGTYKNSIFMDSLKRDIKNSGRAHNKMQSGNFVSTVRINIYEGTPKSIFGQPPVETGGTKNTFNKEIKNAKTLAGLCLMYEYSKEEGDHEKQNVLFSVIRDYLEKNIESEMLKTVEHENLITFYSPKNKNPYFLVINNYSNGLTNTFFAVREAIQSYKPLFEIKFEGKKCRFINNYFETAKDLVKFLKKAYDNRGGKEQDFWNLHNVYDYSIEEQKIKLPNTHILQKEESIIEENLCYLLGLTNITVENKKIKGFEKYKPFKSSKFLHTDIKFNGKIKTEETVHEKFTEYTHTCGDICEHVFVENKKTSFIIITQLGKNGEGSAAGGGGCGGGSSSSSSSSTSSSSSEQIIAKISFNPDGTHRILRHEKTVGGNCIIDSETSELFGYKETWTMVNNRKVPCIVKLKIPSDSLISTETGQKYRTNRAFVEEMFIPSIGKCAGCDKYSYYSDESTRTFYCSYHKTGRSIIRPFEYVRVEESFSSVDKDFKYCLGKMINVPDFSAAKQNCGIGIHFCIGAQMAICFDFLKVNFREFISWQRETELNEQQRMRLRREEEALTREIGRLDLLRAGVVEVSRTEHETRPEPSIRTTSIEELELKPSESLYDDSIAVSFHEPILPRTSSAAETAVILNALNSSIAEGIRESYINPSHTHTNKYTALLLKTLKMKEKSVPEEDSDEDKKDSAYVVIKNFVDKP